MYSALMVSPTGIRVYPESADEEVRQWSVLLTTMLFRESFKRD